MAVGICPEYFSANRWETVGVLIDLECWDKRVRKLVKTNYKILHLEILNRFNYYELINKEK